MSSHHIVREKQEPALLVFGLNYFTDDELGQLLEWSPTLIATPPVAEQLYIYGIKIDYVITDNAADIEQSDVKSIPAGNFCELTAALEFLIANGYPAVNIVTHELDLDIYGRYVHQINLVIFSNKKKIYVINSGFRKWKPAGEAISVLNSTINITTEGLQQTSPQQYETIADGFFSISFDARSVFIAEEW
jgi:thiamine pyrophosphokinase